MRNNFTVLIFGVILSLQYNTVSYIITCGCSVWYDVTWKTHCNYSRFRNSKGNLKILKLSWPRVRPTFSAVSCVKCWFHSVISQQLTWLCCKIVDVNSLETAGTLLRLGQGSVLPPPQMWHETLFDELKALAYRCKKERSVAFKIRQNVSAPDQSSQRPPDPLVLWGGSARPQTPPYWILRCSPWFGWGTFPPEYFSVRTAPEKLLDVMLCRELHW